MAQQVTKAAKQEIEVTFKKEKETKNAVRYQEEGTDGGENRGKIGTLYVQKATFGKAIPEEITVTIAY